MVGLSALMAVSFHILIWKVKTKQSGSTFTAKPGLGAYVANLVQVNVRHSFPVKDDRVLAQQFRKLHRIGVA
jgi:hypothetical protein